MGGIIGPSPWQRTPAAPPQLGQSMPPLPLLLATASIEHDSGARGMTTRAGGGQGAARDATRRPSVDAWAINIASATPTQQQRGPNAIAVPGRGQQAWGGGEGPHAQKRRGHLSMCGPSKQPQPLLLSDRAPQQKYIAMGTTSTGEGTTGRVRRNAADTTRRRAVLKNIKKELTCQWGQAGEDILATIDDCG